jgi:hypothetical protein
LFNNRDKPSLDIFWVRDDSLEEFDNLLDADVLGQKIDSYGEAETVACHT